MTQTVEKVLVGIEPVLVGVEDAASMLGISPTGFKALERTASIGPLPVRLGTCPQRAERQKVEMNLWQEPNHEHCNS